MTAPPESAIADHGLIGDLRTAALVDRWGRLSWLCWPSFDSPPLFRRLIDPDAGGCWETAPAAPFDTTRRYLEDSNVLETTFRCGTGVVVAYDFMAVPAEPASRLLRIVEGRSGTVEVRSSMRATDGFGSAQLAAQQQDGAVWLGGRTAVLSCNRPVEVAGDAVHVHTRLGAGDRLVMALGAEPMTQPELAAATDLRDATAAWWREWIGRCSLPVAFRDEVARSALAVKMLQHHESSALVAAPTTSLPEEIGGVRNWDYRYSWLRDSSMMVLALQRLGLHDEAMGLWRWLADSARRGGEELAVAYTVAGGALPPEQHVDHLPGHRGSRPVRVGNAVRSQRQHDVYGHVLAAAAQCYRGMDGMDVADPQELLQRVADLAAERWSEPDDSIWEVRSGRDQHTYSQLMCWHALDEAIDLSRRGALTGDSRRWVAARSAVRRHVLGAAWNPDVGAFTGTTGGSDIDAATLVAPLVGFLPADDPRCRSTRRVVTERLSDRGLLRRYAYDDGVAGKEGAFLLCSLWLADNHTLDGDPDAGANVLERVLSTANDLGLLAEQADPATDSPLGNFPQGLTHLGVIQSAHRLAGAW